MGLILDRIDSWLNGRDNAAVEEELLAVDAAEADEDEYFAVALKASSSEEEARRLIAEAKAHEREVDVAESDSDDWGPPEWVPPQRRERIEYAEGADDQLSDDEAQADEVQ
jgi:hypothetical protein